MKFTVTFKDPDGLDMSLQDMSKDDQSVAREFCKRFLEWDEYMTVEFDTETGDAKVLTVK